MASNGTLLYMYVSLRVIILREVHITSTCISNDSERIFDRVIKNPSAFCKYEAVVV